MKIKSYFMMALAMLALNSCDDDFGDWAEQATNEQEATVTFGNGSVSEVGVIDLRTVSTETVQVATITAPTSSDASYTPTYYINLGDNSYAIEADGTMTTDDLANYVVSLYGKRPVEREVEATITALVSNGSTTTRINSGTFKITAIPQAPNIDTKYYITGGINGWSNSDTTYPVENGGGDVYDDPVFTILLSADAVGDGFEFKLTPVSKIGTNDWSECITAPEGGDGLPGKLVDANAGGNLKLEKTEGAKLYRLEFNLLDQTWTASALSFNQYIYAVGAFNNWSDDGLILLSTANYDGQYMGFGVLNGEYKFRPNANNWKNDFGQNPNGAAGTLVTEGESNCGPVDEAYYGIKVDMAAMTYSVTPITTIGVIGDGAVDWNTDVPMTYDKATNTWNVTTTLTGGKQIKFRANGGWDFNWGGPANNPVQGGANIDVPESGTYEISLSALCDGQASYTLTKK